MIGKMLRQRKQHLQRLRGQGFPGCPESKESPTMQEETGFGLWLGRSPGEGNGYPLQYSCLENSMDRGAWQAIIVHGTVKSWTRLSDYHFHSVNK